MNTTVTFLCHIVQRGMELQQSVQDRTYAWRWNCPWCFWSLHDFRLEDAKGTRLLDDQIIYIIYHLRSFLPSTNLLRTQSWSICKVLEIDNAIIFKRENHLQTVESFHPQTHNSFLSCINTLSFFTIFVEDSPCCTKGDGCTRPLTEGATCWLLEEVATRFALQMKVSLTVDGSEILLTTW